MRAMQRGFTLIELMLVVLIIGIMTSIAVPYFQSSIARANRSEAQVVLSKMRLHFINLYENTGSFASGAVPLPKTSTVNPPAGGPAIGHGAPWDSTQADWRELSFPPEGTIKMRYFYTVNALDQLMLTACGNFPGFGPNTQNCGNLGLVANYTYVEQYQGTSQIAVSPIETPSM